MKRDPIRIGRRKRRSSSSGCGAAVVKKEARNSAPRSSLVEQRQKEEEGAHHKEGKGLSLWITGRKETVVKGPGWRLKGIRKWQLYKGDLGDNPLPGRNLFRIRVGLSEKEKKNRLAISQD